MSFIPQERPTDVYLGQRDIRPSVETLESMYADIYPRGQNIDLATEAIAGDVCLDLAQATRITSGIEAEEWVYSAAEHFRRVISTTLQYEQQQTRHAETLTNKAAQWMVYSCFKEAEIVNWLHAVRSGTLENVYPALLDAAEAAYPFMMRTDESRARTAEAVPLMLAARAGTIGRWALAREGSVGADRYLPQYASRKAVGYWPG